MGLGQRVWACCRRWQARFALALLVLLALVLWLLAHPRLADIVQLQAFMAVAKPWFLAWRLLLLGVAIAGYRRWVNLLAASLKFTPAQRGYALSQRWQVAAALLLTEVLFCQNGLGHGLRLLARIVY
ncbi:MAG: hypothetical protein WC757_00045 [Candidatus Paceibacterota bacterium]